MNVSGFQTYGLHQVLTRQIAKTEFVLGVVQSIVNTINIGGYQHVQQKVVDIIVTLETMKALLIKSEVEAKRDEFGFIRPDLPTVQVAIQMFPKIYPTFTEIIQLLGASGLMSIPSEKHLLRMTAILSIIYSLFRMVERSASKIPPSLGFNDE